MSAVIDNLIAYRFLYMLVKPFAETDAYKLGVIDATGKTLIKSKDRNSEQQASMTYLHRLVFNIKKLLNKLPGGESMLKNIVAAFLLLRESYDAQTTQVSEQQLADILDLIDSGIVFAEETLVVEEFLLTEEMGAGVANVTGPGVSTDAPVIRRKPKRFAKFVVNDEVYNKFASGKSKYRKWSHYLNLEDDGQRTIYDFARKNPKGVIVLHNGKDTKAIRFNRRGGGSWSKLKRPTNRINNGVI